MSRVVIRPAADSELDAAADYLQLNGSPDRAVRFLRDANRTFARLAASPGIGTPYQPDDPRFGDLRYFPLSRFKARVVFYRPLPDGIEVWHVLHGARDYVGILSDDLGADEE